MELKEKKEKNRRENQMPMDPGMRLKTTKEITSKIERRKMFEHRKKKSEPLQQRFSFQVCICLASN